MTSERVVRGWRTDQIGQAIAAAAAVDSHSRFVGAVDNHSLFVVALGNQYIVLLALACGVVVGSPWQGYWAAGQTRRFDSRQASTMPAPVRGTAAAAVAAIVVAGRTAGCIQWDLFLRNQCTAAVAAAVVAAASQRSIAGTMYLEKMRHLDLEIEKRRWRCGL